MTLCIDVNSRYQNENGRKYKWEMFKNLMLERNSQNSLREMAFNTISYPNLSISSNAQRI